MPEDKGDCKGVSERDQAPGVVCEGCGAAMGEAGDAARLVGDQQLCGVIQ